MRYLPICARYGQLPYYATWIALPYVALATGHLYFALFYLNSYLLFGICLEHGVAAYLKKKQVGIRRGTRMLNGAQIAGVVLAVLMGVGVQKIGEIYLPDDLKPVERLTTLHMPHVVPLHPVEVTTHNASQEFLPIHFY